LVVGAVASTTMNGWTAPFPKSVVFSPEPGRHNNIQKTAGPFDWLFGGYQQDPPTKALAEPQGRQPDEGEGQRERPRVRRNDGRAGTYRTLCVRLCDGFYFPLSFATTRAKVRDDAARCERQCPSRSRLYFHRSEQAVDDMVDLDGQPYTRLPVAFRFRETYVPDCTCHGNPWDAEAIARHQEYARNPLPSQSAPTAAAEQPKTAEPRRSSRQTSWGYRSRRASDDD
jgi:hypothetical protein